jgi:hypothetical protein
MSSSERQVVRSRKEKRDSEFVDLRMFTVDNLIAIEAI